MITAMINSIFIGIVAGIVAWSIDILINRLHGQIIYKEEEKIF